MLNASLNIFPFIVVIYIVAFLQELVKNNQSKS